MPFRPRQADFRGRGDTDALNTNTFDYAAHTNWTQQVGTTFRVRFLVQEAGATAGSDAFKLRASLNGGTYQDVTSSSTIVKLALSGQYADKDATSSLLGGAGTFVAGAGLETSTSTNTISIAASGRTEVEFSLQIVAADVAHGDTIALRVYRGTSTALYSYVYTPSITVSEPDSGSLSKTLGGLTLAATGQSPSQGALAKTLTILGLVAAGTVTTPLSPVEGSLGKTLSGLTLAASGTVVSNVAGALDDRLDAMTLSASGCAYVSGAAAKDLGALTLAGAGIVSTELFGTLNATMGGMTLQGTGTVEVRGEIAGLLANTTANGSGQVLVAGVGAATLGALTVNADGDVVISCVTDRTLADLALSASGTITPGSVDDRFGSLSKTLGAATISATGAITGTAPSAIVGSCSPLGRMAYSGAPRGTTTLVWLAGTRSDRRGITRTVVPYVPPVVTPDIWTNVPFPPRWDTISTYDGSGQPVHPSVLNAGTGNLICGVAQYVMAMTPYPGEESTYEFPSMVVADNPDGPWSVPAGLTNPIFTGPPGWILVDPDIVMDGSTLRMCWVGPTLTPTYVRSVMASSTTDLVNWTTPTQLYTADNSTGDYTISPSMVYRSGTWISLSFDLAGTLYRRTSSAYTGPWSAPTYHSMRLPSGLAGWHLDAIVDAEGILWAGVCSHVDDALWLCRSTDAGVTWQVSAQPMLANYGAGNYHYLYRPSLLSRGAAVTDDGVDVWVSGYDQSTHGAYGIGYTHGDVAMTT